jgi:predicted nuclease of predicted toxin-antitoxin system
MTPKRIVRSEDVSAVVKRAVNAEWAKLPISPRKVRAYFDNNIPTAVATRVRDKLGWDVFAVAEQPEFQNKDDEFHYQNARNLKRLLFTRDADFLDDRRYPLRESPGLIVLSTRNDVDDIVFAFEAAAISLVEAYRKVPEFGRQMKTTLNLEGHRIRFITKSSEVVELVAPLLSKKRK